jgi:hypothetical protein
VRAGRQGFGTCSLRVLPVGDGEGREVKDSIDEFGKRVSVLA